MHVLPPLPLRWRLSRCLWVLALSTLLGLASCQNPVEGTTLVEGQVIEHVGRQPVGGATVHIWQAGKAEGYGPVGGTSLQMSKGASPSASRPIAKVAI